MAQELGQYQVGDTIDFDWDSYDSNGASITRAVNGTISVYKGNNTTQTVVGVTDTEDFDGVAGSHHVRIVCTDAFYVRDEDYMVKLAGATIDGQTVNATLARFSLDKRLPEGVIQNSATGTPTTTVIDTNLTETGTNLFVGRKLIILTGTQAGEATNITAYNGTTKELTVEPMASAISSGDIFLIV